MYLKELNAIEMQMQVLMFCFVLGCAQDFVKIDSIYEPSTRILQHKTRLPLWHQNHSRMIDVTQKRYRNDRQHLSPIAVEPYWKPAV